MPEYLTPLLLALIVLLLLLVAFWLHARIREMKPRPEDQQALAELKGQVGSFTVQMESLRHTVTTLQGQLVNTLTETRGSMDKRLDGTARVIHEVNQNLGQLAEKTKQLSEIGRDIASLQDILRAPKLRGNLGELFLADLLAQILPPDHFTTQHDFQGGETVDAVIKLKSGLVPVDAKFPLENFQRVVKAESEAEKKTARQAFIRDVKRHIDAIAQKYIRPDEGTLDFALMYIPAENVYYETIIKDDELGAEGALFEHAMKKRVIPVSPNSFYAYLQTILLGLKGLRVEENVRRVIDQLARVHTEVEKFSEAFRLIGTHLDNSRAKYADAQQRLEKVDQKLAQIDGVIQGSESPTLPP